MKYLTTNLFSLLTLFLILFFPKKMFGESIDELSKKLLTEHPEIRALESELKSKKADGFHKNTYPDPKIGFAYRSFPYSKDARFVDSKPNTPSMTGIEYTVSQEIPFPGKLTTEGRIGKLAAEEAKFFTKLQKNRFLKDFYTLLLKYKLNENKIRWNKSASEVLSSIEKITKSNFSVKKNSYLKVVKNKINLTMIKDKEIEFEFNRENLKKSIQYFSKPIQVDFEKIQKIDIINFLTEKSKILGSEQIQSIEKRLPKNPNLRLSETTILKNKEEEKLAKISHLPETEIFFSYMKRRDQKFVLDSGPLEYKIMDSTEFRGDLMSFGLTMRVPVWSMLTKSDLSNREEEKVKSSVFETEKRFAEIETIFKNALSYYKGINSQIKLREETLLPQLKQAQIAQSTIYQTGTSDLADTLELKLEILNNHLTQEDLLEKKYLSLITILELTDMIIPENQEESIDPKGEKK